MPRIVQAYDREPIAEIPTDDVVALEAKPHPFLNAAANADDKLVHTSGQLPSDRSASSTDQ